MNYCNLHLTVSKKGTVLGSPKNIILDKYPYPIAYPYKLIFEESKGNWNRLWAIGFTQYQLLKTVALPLIGQYLYEDIDESASNEIKKINRAIASIKSPFHSDWINAVHCLSKNLPSAGIEPIFTGLTDAIRKLKDEVKPRPFGLAREHKLDPFKAILAMRNELAHGGLERAGKSDDTDTFNYYLATLHKVLDAFSFLSRTTLTACLSNRDDFYTGSVTIQTLIGAKLPVEEELELKDGIEELFEESCVIMKGANGKATPLYPFFKVLAETDPVTLYDGHYGVRVKTRQTLEERSYIYYLGMHNRTKDSSPCDRLKELLENRKIDFFLKKSNIYPWTIADTAYDYSLRTLNELKGTKYFPECYLPFIEIENSFIQFLKTPDTTNWPKDLERRRYVNGFILTGAAGAGKTAFLAHEAEKLLMSGRGNAERENPNLILFLRGNGIVLRPDGMSLFKDIAEKLGVAVTGTKATLNKKKDEGFSSFRELLMHLHSGWKDDRVPGRRFIIILDALNEAPFAEKVIKEALEIISVAASFPWCKVVVSIRLEWLGLWQGKIGAQEKNPIEELRPYLYHLQKKEINIQETRQISQNEEPPYINIEPLTLEQAATVYNNYQKAQQNSDNNEKGYGVSACKTAWIHLTEETRHLLQNPLYIHLFMQTFNNIEAEQLTTIPALFKRYVNTVLQEHSGLKKCVDAIISHILEDVQRPSADLTDDDCNAIRERWIKGKTAEELRLDLSPVEGLVHEGLMSKRIREEGGGLRFIFQAVAEYLIYCQLKMEKPVNEDELEYWARLAGHKNVFPEYAGAFAYLIRELVGQNKFEDIAPLVESSHFWLIDVLISFLIEQARSGINRFANPWIENKIAENIAKVLISQGGINVAQGLNNAGYKLAHSDDAYSNIPAFSTAICYYQTSVQILESLYINDRGNVIVANNLLVAQAGLYPLLSMLGKDDEVQKLLERYLEISKTLYLQYPHNFDFADKLIRCVNTLALFFYLSGNKDDAQEKYEYSLEICKTLHSQNPTNVIFVEHLDGILNALFSLLNKSGSYDDAPKTLKYSMEVCEELYLKYQDNIIIASRLARNFHDIANWLYSLNEAVDAQKACAFSINIYTTIYAKKPKNVEIALNLARSYGDLGYFLQSLSQLSNALKTYECSIEILEPLYSQDQKNMEVTCALAFSFHRLGTLLLSSGKQGEAQKKYERSVEICEALYLQNSENTEVVYTLAASLNNIGTLLSSIDKQGKAQKKYERSIEIYEALYLQDPENVKVANALTSSLENFGKLLQSSNNKSESQNKYERSIEIRTILYNQYPKNLIPLYSQKQENLEIACSLATSLNKLGYSFLSSGKKDEAQKKYERSVEISETLYLQNPTNVKVAYIFAGSLNDLGVLFLLKNEQDEFQNKFERSIEIFETLYSQNMGNVGVANALVSTLENFSILLQSSGNKNESQNNLKRSNEIRTILCKENPENIEIKTGDVSSICIFGSFEESIIL